MRFVSYEWYPQEQPHAGIGIHSLDAMNLCHQSSQGPLCVNSCYQYCSPLPLSMRTSNSFYPKSVRTPHRQAEVNEPSGSNKNLFRVAPLAMLAGLPEKIVALVQDLQDSFPDVCISMVLYIGLGAVIFNHNQINYLYSI